MHYLSQLTVDKKLATILHQHKLFKLRKRENVSLRLCASIMSQQLSSRVADVIYSRFLDLFNGGEPSPEQILQIKPEKLRSIGLSNAKVAYVHNVARFAVEEGLDHKILRKQSDEEVIQYLTRIKGVGRWTAEMILMFTLGREDIFAVDDLGIQNAMQKLYKLDSADKKKMKKRMLVISEKWKPYRTYACLHLWRWKDAK